MENLTDKQIISKIKQAKNKLSKKQCRENFGGKEMRLIKDMFCIYTCSEELSKAYNDFCEWCYTFEGYKN